LEQYENDGRSRQDKRGNKLPVKSFGVSYARMSNDLADVMDEEENIAA